MNNNRHIILIAAFTALVSAAASCTNEEEFPGTQNTKSEVVFTTSAMSTKTAIDESDNSVNWLWKDNISVFSSLAPNDNEKFTTVAVNKNSADFKGEVTKGGTYYCLYPYKEENTFSGSALKSYLSEEQLAEAGTFSTSLNPSVAVSDNNLLEFNNVCAIIKFTSPMIASGDLQRIVLKGNSGESLSGGYEVNIGTKPFKAVPETDSKDFISLNGPFTVGESYYFVVLPQNLTKGVNLEFHTSTGKILKRSTDKPLELNQGRLYKINEFSLIEEGEAIDISASGSANCYMITKPGKYAFSLVKGNSNESVGNTETASVLWESFGTDTAPVSGELIQSVEIEDGKIVFETPEVLKPGNAVIAAKDASGNILWSWHIWMSTEQIQEIVYKNDAGVMMDRNLGAISAEKGNPGALGLLYQWGRKDPFLGSSSIASSVRAASTGEWGTAQDSYEGKGSKLYAIQHPTTFITEIDATGKWCNDEDNLELWSNEKTIYDPCPAGWRLPYGGPQGFWVKCGFVQGAYWVAFSAELKGITLGTARYCSTATWYPAAGLITPLGVFSDTGTSGYMWSADVNANADGKPYHFTFTQVNNKPCDPAGYSKAASARTVRCIKE